LTHIQKKKKKQKKPTKKDKEERECTNKLQESFPLNR